MRSKRLQRWMAIALTVSGFALPAKAAVAGNMSLTISGITGTIDVLHFTHQLSRSVGATKISWADAAFSALESAAAPPELLLVASGQHANSAVLQIVSPTTGQLTSDWTFTSIRMTSFNVERAAGLPATTSFSFSFARYSYRTYNADGTVAQTACWDVTGNAAC